MSDQQIQRIEEQLGLARGAPGTQDEGTVRGLPDLGAGLPAWRLVRAEARPDASPPSAQAFVRPTDEGAGEVVFVIDVSALPSAAAAHQFLLRVLAEFQSPLLRVLDGAGIGDVAVGHGDTAVVARRANIVFVVRNAGDVVAPVLAVAQAVDALVR